MCTKNHQKKIGCEEVTTHRLVSAVREGAVTLGCLQYKERVRYVRTRTLFDTVLYC